METTFSFADTNIDTIITNVDGIASYFLENDSFIIEKDKIRWWDIPRPIILRQKDLQYGFPIADANNSEKNDEDFSIDNIYEKNEEIIFSLRGNLPNAPPLFTIRDTLTYYTNDIPLIFLKEQSEDNSEIMALLWATVIGKHICVCTLRKNNVMSVLFAEPSKEILAKLWEIAVTKIAGLFIEEEKPFVFRNANIEGFYYHYEGVSLTEKILHQGILTAKFEHNYLSFSSYPQIHNFPRRTFDEQFFEYSSFYPGNEFLEETRRNFDERIAQLGLDRGDNSRDSIICDVLGYYYFFYREGIV